MVNSFEKAIKAIVQNLLQELIVRTSVIVKTNAKVPYLEEKKIVFEVYVNIGSWQLKKSLSDKFRFQTIFLLHQPSLAGLPWCVLRLLYLPKWLLRLVYLPIWLLKLVYLPT